LRFSLFIQLFLQFLLVTRAAGQLNSLPWQLEGKVVSVSISIARSFTDSRPGDAAR